MLMLSLLGWELPQLTEVVSSWVQQLKQWKTPGRFSLPQPNTSLSS